VLVLVGWTVYHIALTVCDTLLAYGGCKHGVVTIECTHLCKVWNLFHHIDLILDVNIFFNCRPKVNKPS
jgi:hypothetical protein